MEAIPSIEAFFYFYFLDKEIKLFQETLMGVTIRKT